MARIHPAWISQKSDTMLKNTFHEDSRNWFTRMRFGFFVHWGIYSVGGRHEQELWRYQMPAAEYEAYADRFNPRKFNPKVWLDMAQEAGMQYMVFTAKHHDGFCLWDTRETEYNIMHTPFKRDIVGMLAEECHKRHFPLELYYSCVDWHHPAYPNLGRHHEITTDLAKHDLPAYMEFVKRQIRELCTNYGAIHGIWWDMNVPEYTDLSINKLIRQLQPQAVINNRGFGPGDYSTPERVFQTGEMQPFPSPVEACDSIGMNSWGFRKEEDYFSIKKLQRQIALYLALGGNFLLNAGPKPDGTFPVQAKRIFHSLGKWYQKVKPALTAPPCLKINPTENLLCTGINGELFLIFLETPAGETVRLPGLNQLPVRAELLNHRQVLEATLEPTAYTLQTEPALRLRKLPVNRMHQDIQVAHLKF